MFDNNVNIRDVSQESISHLASLFGYASGYAGCCILFDRKVVPEKALEASNSIGPTGWFFPVLRAEVSRFKDLKRLLSEGWRFGIHIHPASLGGDRPQLLRQIDAWFGLAADFEVPVFLCTHSARPRNHIAWSLLQELLRLRNEFSSVRVVVLHSGISDLWNWVEALKYDDGVLLDLSHTLVLLDQIGQLNYFCGLFEKYDLKFSVGSDFPFHSLEQYRRAIDALENRLPKLSFSRISELNSTAFLADFRNGANYSKVPKTSTPE